MEVLIAPEDVKPNPADLEASSRNLAVNSRQRTTTASLSTSSSGVHAKIASVNSSSARNNSHHHSSITPSASLLSSSAPVRITTLSGQQLQTMAKSSGLSVVHVTVPQVSKEIFCNQ